MTPETIKIESSSLKPRRIYNRYTFEAVNGRNRRYAIWCTKIHGSKWNTAVERSSLHPRINLGKDDVGLFLLDGAFPVSSSTQSCSAANMVTFGKMFVIMVQMRWPIEIATIKFITMEPHFEFMTIHEIHLFAESDISFLGKDVVDLLWSRPFVIAIIQLLDVIRTTKPSPFVCPFLPFHFHSRAHSICIYSTPPPPPGFGFACCGRRKFVEFLHVGAGVSAFGAVGA